jgi:hypothetical protein
MNVIVVYKVMQVFRLKAYLKAMRAMGFDEAGMAEIERSICAAPNKHPTIRGLRGVHKARFARPGTGKSGGGRAIYYVIIGLGRLYMMTAYAKSRQEDLTGDDRKAILRIIEQLLSGDQ